MARPNSFMAQDGYLVTQANYLTDFDQAVVTALYQPLVGPTPFALYLSLWPEASTHPVITERKAQTRLLDLLNVDVDTLYVARTTLEAVGLLKTYTAVDQLGRYYAYELYAPVNPQTFFDDDLLGLLLFDRVGAERYAELVNQFTLHPVRRAEWDDVSAGFLDVFSLRHSLTPPEPVVAARDQLIQKPTPKVALPDEGYDWDLLTQLTAGFHLKAGQLSANQEALYQVARFYGLNPPDLARLIGKAADITGKLDMNSLRRLAEQRYRDPQRAAFTPQKEGAQPVVKTAAPQPAGTSWTPAEQQLLTRAQELSPREFLEATKKAKNARAFATANESFAVADLVRRHVFDQVTVNLLVAYILQSYDSLSQALLGNFANKWVAADVTDATSALLQMRKEQAAKATPKPRKGARPSRAEAQPEWLKADYQASAPAVSESQQQRIQERLATLKKLDQKGDDLA